jgi:pimeloyl-ACP methyl ester carboxylesterase
MRADIEPPVAEGRDGFVEAGGHRLEYRLIAAGKRGLPTLVFLHEGLGSLAMWRDFPAQVAALSGCRTLVYSRYSYGRSDPLERPHGVDYMHREARVVLPDLLAALEIEEPLLVGHSDGASIALIYAGTPETNGRNPAVGVVAMAPHVFVEDVTVESIAEARTAWETTDLPKRLGRYHADADGAFRGWNDIWLHPDFRAWTIEEVLANVTCPVLAIQGLDDQYGTMAQLDAIERGVAGTVERLELTECKHSPHRDRADSTRNAILNFVSQVSA